ncbi:MAG: hypothetical protein HQK83_18995 [Fibrobacteria bacterium]|nr:hypothetical protein [Fibrobacteria bacterium]
MFIQLLKMCCRWCQKIFFLCRSCWRGQAYCGDECRRAGKLKLHREAQRRYRQSEKGKKAHRLAEDRRRKRRNEKKNNENEKKLDDLSSTSESNELILPPSNIQFGFISLNLKPKHKLGALKKCHNCQRIGVIMEKFPRQGFVMRN